MVATPQPSRTVWPAAASERQVEKPVEPPADFVSDQRNERLCHQPWSTIPSDGGSPRRPGGGTAVRPPAIPSTVPTAVPGIPPRPTDGPEHVASHGSSRRSRPRRRPRSDRPARCRRPRRTRCRSCPCPNSRRFPIFLCSASWTFSISQPEKAGVDIVTLDLRSDRNDGQAATQEVLDVRAIGK